MRHRLTRNCKYRVLSCLTFEFHLYRLEEVSKSGPENRYEEIFRAKALGLLDILTVVPSLRLTADFIF